MGDTSPGCYFLKATNTAFHDLTKGESMPLTATSLLGLSLKFIPTPRYAPSAMDIAPFFDSIECDIGLKKFFAGRGQGEVLEEEVPTSSASWSGTLTSLLNTPLRSRLGLP
jgi:hypothetical protein